MNLDDRYLWEFKIENNTLVIFLVIKKNWNFFDKIDFIFRWNLKRNNSRYF